MSLLADNFIKLEWVSIYWFRHVNPSIDSQVLLFHRMSEKSVVLHEELTSSQADTVSVVGSARTHFANSINLHVPLKKISYGYGQGESGNPGETLEKLVVGDHGETDEDAGNEQTSKVRVSMLFLVLQQSIITNTFCVDHTRSSDILLPIFATDSWKDQFSEKSSFGSPRWMPRIVDYQLIQKTQFITGF